MGELADANSRDIEPRFSFLMVALKMEIGRSCKGVSLKMMECLAELLSFLRASQHLDLPGATLESLQVAQINPGATL